MVALPVVPKVLQVRLIGTYLGSEWMNGFYLQYAGAGPPTGADLLSLGDGIEADWFGSIGVKLSVNTILTSVELTDLNSYDGATATAAANKAGGAGGGCQANVAVCVSFKQSRRYRGGHPRMYLCGVPTADLADPAHVTSIAAAAYATAMEAFRDLVETHTLTSTGALKWCTVSRYQGHTFDAEHNKIPTPLASPIIRLVESFTCNVRLDSQRRRLGK